MRRICEPSEITSKDEGCVWGMTMLLMKKVNKRAEFNRECTASSLLSPISIRLIHEFGR